MPLRNVATTFTIEQQRLEINNLAGDVNNIASGATATTASSLAAGATGTDLTLSGTLTVNGTQTILNTATLEVEDKNILIAKGSTTDAAASGGGITLKGANDKTISYNQTGDKWVSNKDFEVPQLIATQGATTEFIQATSTNNGTRAVGSFEGKDSSGNAVTLKMGGYGDTNRGEIFTHSNHALGFATNNAATQMVLDTSGQLGIGILSPTRKLDVRESGANDIATFINSDTTNGYGVNIKGGGTAANRYALRVANGADTECFKVKADGYIEFTGSNDLRVTLGSTGTAGGNTSNWIRASGADFMYNSASGDHIWEIGGTEAGRLTASGWEDGIGNLRSIPANNQPSAYSLASSDAGKCVLAGGQISIPSDVGFVEGDAVTIINHSGSAIDFSHASVTLYNTADGTALTHPSSMGARGMCTIYFVSNTVAYISGSQVS